MSSISFSPNHSLQAASINTTPSNTSQISPPNAVERESMQPDEYVQIDELTFKSPSPSSSGASSDSATVRVFSPPSVEELANDQRGAPSLSFLSRDAFYEVIMKRLDSTTNAFKAGYQELKEENLSLKKRVHLLEIENTTLREDLRDQHINDRSNKRKIGTLETACEEGLKKISNLLHMRETDQDSIKNLSRSVEALADSNIGLEESVRRLEQDLKIANQERESAKKAHKIAQHALDKKDAILKDLLVENLVDSRARIGGALGAIIPLLCAVPGLAIPSALAGIAAGVLSVRYQEGISEKRIVDYMYAHPDLSRAQAIISIKENRAIFEPHSAEEERESPDVILNATYSFDYLSPNMDVDLA
jgi:hypothetical protein